MIQLLKISIKQKRLHLLLEVTSFEYLTSNSRMYEDFYCTLKGMVDAGLLWTKNVLNLQFSMKSTISITSLPISESVLKQKYLKNQLSIREIAKEFSCSKTKIRDLLLKYEIPLRVSSGCHQRHDSRIYGKKKVNGQTVDHKRKLKTIEVIKKLYLKSINPNTIAKVLSIMKIPTKQQKKEWHHHTIINLLKRENLYKKEKPTT